MTLLNNPSLFTKLNTKCKIGKKKIKLDFKNQDDFVHFYLGLQVAKGPLFESSLQDHSSSKWSFFSILPKSTYTKSIDEFLLESTDLKQNGQSSFFDQIDKLIFQIHQRYPGLEQFPFIGGFMGFLSYENFFETKGALKLKQHSFPLYQFSFFKNSFLFNLETQESFLVYDEDIVLNTFDVWRHKIKFDSTPNLNNKIILQPNISKDQYLKKIDCVFEHIKKGDIYQANFTHKFNGTFNGNPNQIYNLLRKNNPSPFSSFYAVNDHQFILCSSPERLFKVVNSKIISSPIKGTIRRDNNPIIDNQLKQELLNSPKDSAELAMIVDLIRNDLGKISNYGTVKVLDYKKLETFQKVHHLIGTVEGQLKSKTTIKEIFSALFPGGSITGAPKIRSIEILNELEEQARGPYTGSLGYIDIRGNMDFNIMIRTILIDKNAISLQVGGGIVIDSDPAKEYEETLHKAQALFDALSFSHN
jgi:anthranilate/para-aminobenzoate synthase component I